MDAAQIVGALLRWYRRSARELPWRTDPTPYAVLLSELMLQQTRVETVIPYFRAFLARWPTLGDLAAAEEREVVEAWAGLGYYSRARNLHRAARAVDGRLPRTAAELSRLPGIGPYTAGAIASIAFGERAPLVDGNVERVLSRLDARDADPRSPVGRRALWDRAAELHRSLPDGDAPGDLNQALMELGATICTPRGPRCPHCPLVAGCSAAASGDPERLPVRAAKAPPLAIRGAALVAGVGGRWWMGRRAPGGLLGGLWEPPRAEGGEAELRALLGEIGLKPVWLARRGEVVHVFTHRRLTCEVFEGEVVGAPTVARPYDAVELRAADAGLSALARRILAAVPQLGLPLAAEVAAR